MTRNAMQLRSAGAVLLSFAAIGCSVTQRNREPIASPPNPPEVAPARIPPIAQPAPVPVPTTEATTVCEGPRHLDAPAAGVANDEPFDVRAVTVSGESEGDYPSLTFAFGTHADRFRAGDAYRGVTISVFADAPSFTIEPGTFAIPHWEKNGPIWSAMINVSSGVGLGMNARGELVIDEIVAAKGKTPATVRGHAWICVDPIEQYPGAQWMGGTFTATVDKLDAIYHRPATFKAEAGRIEVTRPPKSRAR